MSAPEPARSYDVVVLGAGAVGENVADRAGRTGLSVAVVEAELVDGARQAVYGDVDPAAVLRRRDRIASDWDDQGQVDWLAGAGIDLLRGRARFTGPRTVEVTDDDGDGPRLVVTARQVVVVATGSEPVLPEIPGLAESEPWTSREATAVQDVPDSLAIIGGGVVAVEMATAFADLGTRVTILARGDRLLGGTEPFAGRAGAQALAARGVDLRLRTEVTRVVRDDHGVRLTLDDGGTVLADQVLPATG